jgi:hypothetical protein
MRAAAFVFAEVRVADPGLELGLGEGTGCQKSRKNKQGQRLINASHKVPVIFFVKFAIPMFRDSGNYMQQLRSVKLKVQQKCRK